MRLKIPKSVSSMIRQQRQWQKAVNRVVQQAGLGLGQEAAKPRAKPASAKPAPHLEEVTAFGSNPGHLRMLAYVPPGLKPGAALVVVLHGCQQTAEEFDRASEWSVLARKHGFALLYPEQRHSNNPNLCFNWFRPSAVAEDRGEIGSIRQMIDFLIETHDLSQTAVHVVGLSAGGAMAAALLSVYPERFRAGAIMAGLPFGAVRDAMGALAIMRQAPQKSPQEWAGLVRQASPETVNWPDISIWHGTADEVVDIGNGQALVSQWLGLNGLEDVAPQRSVFPGGERLSWRNARDDIKVEYAILDGFAHGFPISQKQESQPFMLAFPLSLAHLLVERWGLSPAGRKAA
ncbi:extracellular catalytic domain type 1 short-chain-length polyhydroxyalkanoate depolymerase [Rhizobium paknamense]|uniref:Poly(Hydroxyalkanoate) depolymerase family esterase n=1 Tax=Rhizobium paknamense TaxID=1206817 RepID=A0ABU0I770_9HYPH|nr:PHB depolymerase family esterase [Rhizobium paknamense]MDQ0454063.1 poly(hydroxyalkanoate) depolymerase family esterase [Rhizobium paknamense]